MQQWHYYVVMGVCIAAGSALQARAMRHPDFVYYGTGRRFVVRSLCFLLPMILILLPYMAWTLTGFHAADTRTAEKIIVDQYMENGAQRAEAKFIVKDRNTLTGLAKVTLEDGTMLTAPCQADMGEDGQFLVFCS